MYDLPWMAILLNLVKYDTCMHIHYKFRNMVWPKPGAVKDNQSIKLFQHLPCLIQPNIYTQYVYGRRCIALTHRSADVNSLLRWVYTFDAVKRRLRRHALRWLRH